MIEFNNKTRSKVKQKKKKTFDSINSFYEGWELTLNAFKSGIFPLKSTQRKGLKILTSKQMLQTLTLAQVKAVNTSKNLLSKINILCIEQNKFKKYITI